MISEEIIFRRFCFDKMIMPYRDLTAEDKKRIKDTYGWQTYLLKFRFNETMIVVKDEFLKLIGLRKR